MLKIKLSAPRQKSNYRMIFLNINYNLLENVNVKTRLTYFGITHNSDLHYTFVHAQEC